MKPVFQRMETIFQSVTGLVSPKYAHIIKQTCRDPTIIMEVTLTSVKLTGTLKQLLDLTNVFLNNNLKELSNSTEKDTILGGHFQRVNPSEPYFKDKLSPSVGHFSNVTRNTAIQVRNLSLDKKREANYENHSGASKFECEKCSFKTNRQSHMEKHLRMHEENLSILPCPVEGCKYKVSYKYFKN